MSASFSIRSSAGNYRVDIGSDLLDPVLKGAPEPVVLTDAYFRKNFEGGTMPVISVEATESAKAFEAVGDVILRLREAGATRNSTIIAIGGGVIQDVATFCASVYMRGISWIYIPTTLLGMVDSCIGGKSSINVDKYKNIVGNFYPPQRIVIDPAFVRSLSAEQRVAGLCEAAKICFAKDRTAFDQYLSLDPQTGMGEKRLVRTIELSLLSKKWFIEVDEFDRAERQLLNFGHTFGHAIEGASNFGVAHGVAVGLGMLAAIDLARRTGRMPRQTPPVESLVQHVRSLLDEMAGLGRVLQAIDPDVAMDRFSSDKKHEKERYTVIIPDSEGRLARVQLERSASNSSLIREAFVAILQEQPKV